MWVAIAARVATVLVHSRSWFFTNDDWDFLTRAGLGDLLAPHQDHLNVFNALGAQVLRKVVGLDFWPGYGLVVALAWPAVAVVAWWVWRRRGVHPILASGGAILLVWLGSAAYMQFSHVNPAWALMATLLALEFDERRISWRNTGTGLAFSLVAVFANTIGAIAALARLIVALARRQWNGAITAGAAVVVYAVVRGLVAGAADPSFGFGDVIPVIRVALSLVGHGLHAVIPMPDGFEMVAGAVVLVGAVGVVIWSRFSHYASSLVLGAGLWLAAAIIPGYLNVWQPERFDALFHGFPNDHVIWTRFTNVMVVAIVLAGLPALSTLIERRRPGGGIRIGVAVVVASLLAFNLVQSLNVFDRISDKSGPLAEIGGGFVVLASRSEPGLEESRPLHAGTELGPVRVVRMSRQDGGIAEFDRIFNSELTVEVDHSYWLAEHGFTRSLRRSNIFDVQDIVPDVRWARAWSRFRITRRGDRVGSWADLGVDTGTPSCRSIPDLPPLEVLWGTTFDVKFLLESMPGTSGPEEGTDLVVLRLDDDLGRAEVGLIFDPDLFRGNSTLTVAVLGPEAGIGPAVLTVTGPEGTFLCHEKAESGE